MPERDVIVVGASAGGVQALRTLARGLPAGLPAAVFVVQHIGPNGTSRLPRILELAGPLPAAHAEDGEPIAQGRIYIAPPDRHLLVHAGHVRVIRGPRENRSRPAIDPLFRSAAIAYGERVVGVVLTGSLDDGAAGLAAIKERGGAAIVQDPADAEFPSMPKSALELVDVDYSIPVGEMPALLTRLATSPSSDQGTATMADDRELEREERATELDADQLLEDDRPGVPSQFACPDCGGVLWELRDGKLIHFRCRTGHAYSAESLFKAQSDVLENALWSALRALEEKAALARRLSQRASETGKPLVAERFAEQMAAAEDHARVLRELLLLGDPWGSTPLEQARERLRDQTSERDEATG